MDNKALTEFVEAVVRRQFSDAVVDHVTVKPDLDHDGDPILRVTVVVQDEYAKLDPAKVVETSRSLWFELGDAGVEDFPIVSYMTKSDAAGLREPV